MPSLILRPSGLPERVNKPWSLQLRFPGMPETTYLTLAHVSDEVAQQIIEAGEPYWLFGEPDWESRDRLKELERARQLKELANAIEKHNIA